MTIKIDVRNTQIEFDMAGEIVVADTSDEAIAKMLSLKESEFSKEAEEQMKKIQGVTDEDLTAEEFGKLVQICVELYSKIYESVFIDDAFERVHARTKSIQNTIVTFEKALMYVTAEIEKDNAKYQEERQKAMNKYKKRKKK